MNIFAVALPLHYLDIKNTIIEPFLTYRVPSPRPKGAELFCSFISLYLLKPH